MTYFKEEFVNCHLKGRNLRDFIPNERNLPPGGDFPELQMFDLGCL